MTPGMRTHSRQEEERRAGGEEKRERQTSAAGENGLQGWNILTFIWTKPDDCQKTIEDCFGFLSFILFMSSLK